MRTNCGATHSKIRPSMSNSTALLAVSAFSKNLGMTRAVSLRGFRAAAVKLKCETLKDIYDNPKTCVNVMQGDKILVREELKCNYKIPGHDPELEKKFKKDEAVTVEKP